MKQIILAVLLIAIANSCFFDIWKLPPHNFGPLSCKPKPHHQRESESESERERQRQRRPDSRPQIERDRFILSFEYAAREPRCFEDSRAKVYWNGVVVHTISPCDYEIHPVSIEVRTKGEDNILQFEGTGASNGNGLSIDNVRLVRKGTSSRDLVVNGGFERPCLYGVSHKYDRIDGWEGWEGSHLEIGSGWLYNSRWRTQVAELDGGRNLRLTQRFHIEDDCY